MEAVRAKPDPAQPVPRPGDSFLVPVARTRDLALLLSANGKANLYDGGVRSILEVGDVVHAIVLRPDMVLWDADSKELSLRAFEWLSQHTGPDPMVCDSGGPGCTHWFFEPSTPHINEWLTAEGRRMEVLAKSPSIRPPFSLHKDKTNRSIPLSIPTWLDSLAPYVSTTYEYSLYPPVEHSVKQCTIDERRFGLRPRWTAEMESILEGADPHDRSEAIHAFMVASYNQGWTYEEFQEVIINDPVVGSKIRHRPDWLYEPWTRMKGSVCREARLTIRGLMDETLRSPSSEVSERQLSVQMAMLQIAYDAGSLAFSASSRQVTGHVDGMSHVTVNKVMNELPWFEREECVNGGWLMKNGRMVRQAPTWKIIHG